MAFFGLLVQRTKQPIPRHITERPRGGVLIIIMTRELGTLSLEDRKQLINSKITEVLSNPLYEHYATIEFTLGDNIKGDFPGFSLDEARDLLRECLTLTHVAEGEIKYQTVALGTFNDRMVTTIPYVRLAIRR